MKIINKKIYKRSVISNDLADCCTSTVPKIQINLEIEYSLEPSKLTPRKEKKWQHELDHRKNNDSKYILSSCEECRKNVEVLKNKPWYFEPVRRLQDNNKPSDIEMDEVGIEF